MRNPPARTSAAADLAAMVSDTYDLLWANA